MRLIRAFSLLCPVFLIAEAGFAAVVGCGADAVNNPSVDAAVSLGACISAAASQASAANPVVVQLPPGNYYLDSSLALGSLSHLTLRTKGLSSGPACLKPGTQPCAVLIAKPTHRGPDLLSSENATRLTLDHIVLDGNHAPRRANSPSFWNSPSAPGYNAHVHACSGCSFIGLASTRAVRGTGMEFSGDDALFDDVYFFENGWGVTSVQNPPFAPPILPKIGDGPYSDGLTVLSSANLVIRNSTFTDNSDVDLIVGGAPNGRIVGNFIGNSYNFAFAALMLDNFNGTSSGKFAGAIVKGNRIDCGDGKCGLGIDLGPHFWYASPNIEGGNALVTGNTITGAMQGMITVGANGFTLSGNSVGPAATYTDTKSCWAVPFSVSPGDELTISGNNVNPQPVHLWKCRPTDLGNFLVELPGVDFRITHLYSTILGRNPDLEGARGWTANLPSLGLPAIRGYFASSAEARAAVNRAYRQILGREADSSGLSAFTAMLSDGKISVSQLRTLLELTPEALSDPYRRY